MKNGHQDKEKMIEDYKKGTVDTTFSKGTGVSQDN